jgi:hypothetical protein
VRAHVTTATIPEELDHATAWTGSREQVRALVDKHGVRTVCEIGGGRSPLLGLDEVAELGLDYTLLDVSDDELALAPDGYHRACADVCDPDLPSRMPRYDLVFSLMVAEHVPDGERMHRNLYEMLEPGGVAFHFFPTLWYPPYVLNRVLPASLSGWMLRRFAHRPTPKFPARYSKCFGPTPGMYAFLEGIGYEVLDFRPFYGSSYFDKIPVLGALERGLSRWAAARGSTHFSSYAYVVLRRPPSAA